MHITEGVLAGTEHGQLILAAGAVAAGIGTAIGLAKIDYERIPQVAVLSSAFFIVSLIHVPLPPTSFHLVLCGLMGLVLGWAAFAAVLVGLLLQAVFFSVGGLTTLGLNTVVMAAPAVVCYYLFRRPVRSRREPVVFVAGFAAGAVAVMIGGLLQGGSLIAAGSQFQAFGYTYIIMNLPIAAVEGLVTGSVVVLLRKVRPEMLRAPLLVRPAEEMLHG